MTRFAAGSPSRVWFRLGIALVIVGVGLRAWNAWSYLLLFGFDSTHSWDYVQVLRQSWALPQHDAAWSSHRPPFFYYFAAAIARAFGDEALRGPIVSVRLAGSAIGLVCAFAAWDLVRRAGASTRRQVMALGLVLLLPAHLVMSAMFNEEIFVAGFTALAVYAAARFLLLPAASAAAAPSSRDAAGGGAWIAVAGVACGLAWLTKLTGVLAPATVVGALAFEGWRGAGSRRRTYVRAALAVAGLSLVVAGWFYLRHWILTGSPWPVGYSGHELMHTMPPGKRFLGDYLRFPLQVFRAPWATHPDLLRSVWGTAYADLWFDAHRHFIPRTGAAIAPVGTALLLLALVPTVAFLAGLLAGLRRMLAGERGADLPLVALVVVTWIGFVFYTWKNPWFASTKGHYLIGLALPFAYYASEALDAWSRRRIVGPAVLVALGVLAVGCAVAFAFDTPLWDWGARPSGPGLPWRSPDGVLHGRPGG